MKKTRLLEIIREEISIALNEIGQSSETQKATNLTIAAKKAQIVAAQKELAQLTKSGMTEIALEEDLLNETPIYDVSDMEGFKSTLNKFRDENISKSKALNLLLTKLEDEGTVDTNQLSKDMGVDTATFNNQEIRKFLNRPEDEFFENPKTGEELPDFTPYLTKADKKRGRVAGEKPAAEPKATKSKATEPKTTEPKATETDKANAAAASKTPKLDKLANDKDSLLKAIKQAEEERLKIAEKRRNTEDVVEREKLLDDLKRIGKLEGELKNKLANFGY
jgi:hypothetical protein